MYRTRLHKTNMFRENWNENYKGVKNGHNYLREKTASESDTGLLLRNGFFYIKLFQRKKYNPPIAKIIIQWHVIVPLLSDREKITKSNMHWTNKIFRRWKKKYFKLQPLQQWYVSVDCVFSSNKTCINITNITQIRELFHFQANYLPYMEIIPNMDNWGYMKWIKHLCKAKFEGSFKLLTLKKIYEICTWNVGHPFIHLKRWSKYSNAN